MRLKKLYTAYIQNFWISKNCLMFIVKYVSYAHQDCIFNQKYSKNSSIMKYY